MSGARLSLLLVLLALAAGCPGETGSSRTVVVRVHPVGAETVAIWDAEKGFEKHEKASEAVAFEVPADRGLAVRVTVESKEGAETTTGKLAISSVTSALDVGRLATWPARVAFQRENDTLRFSWPALEGPEIPETLRYSLLFVYKKPDGVDGEGTLIAKDKREAIQTLAELSEIFPDRDPKATKMTIRVRAYSASGDEGPIWAGVKQDWEVPKDLPLQQGAK